MVQIRCDPLTSPKFSQDRLLPERPHDSDGKRFLFIRNFAFGDLLEQPVRGYCLHECVLSDTWRNTKHSTGSGKSARLKSLGGIGNTSQLFELIPVWVANVVSHFVNPDFCDQCSADVTRLNTRERFIDAAGGYRSSFSIASRQRIMLSHSARVR